MTVTSSSSPLRQLRDGLSPIQRVAIDGVRYALEMAALSHWRLRHSLDLKSATLEEPLEPDFHTAIFLDAWSTVDSLHRLHQLLLKLPGVKRKDIQLYLDKLSGVRELRNGFQHVDNELPKAARSGFPLWGTVGWVLVENTVAHTFCIAAAGHLTKQWLKFPTDTPGRFTYQPLGLVTLTAFGHSIDLDEMIHELEGLVPHLESHFAKAPDEPTNPTDSLMTLKKLRRPPGSLPPALPEACRDIPPEDAVSFEGAGSGSNCEAQDQQDLGPHR